MRVISGIIKLAATIVIVVFAILNTAPIEVKYFFDRPPLVMPAFIVILGAVLFGVLLSGMLYSIDRLKMKMELSSLKKEIKKQEEEMTRLRNIPFEEPKSPVNKDIL